VRSEILARHPVARLDVLVVWFAMLPGDSRQLIDRRLLADARVTNYWDEQRSVGRWFSQRVPASRGAERQPISWDAYLLYGPDARWDTVPGPLVSVGRTVVAHTRRLGTAVTPLLGA
jgi:hypothetical protein